MCCQLTRFLYQATKTYEVLGATPVANYAQVNYELKL